MQNFEETGLEEDLLKAVKELGFETPTPIQQKVIPALLEEGIDLIALAQTGTGKTAAFGLPALQLTDTAQNNTQTLILSPTRELCLQIYKDLETYGKYKDGIKMLAVYGGSSIEPQIRTLKKGVHIVVGTPGRTVDLIKRKKLKITNLERVILDEADEMLTMGFKEDLEFILSHTPEERQTLLFSATMSPRINEIARKYLKDAEEITVAKKNIGSQNVTHHYYVVHAKNRYELLKRIADMNPDIYGIVFCRTRRETKEVARKLMEDGYNADALHGDMTQAQRDDVMNMFRNRTLQVLVATDVAARGLDVNELTHVINYNLPDSDETYTHRSGRTGRAGNSGISIAIVHTREQHRIKNLERASKVKFSQQMAPTGNDICQKQLLTLIDKIQKVKVNEHQIEPFLPEIYAKLEWLDREQLIKHFVSAEFNRFLAYYKNAQDINVNGKRDKKTVQERRRTEFARVFISLGNKQGLTPARLIGLINETLNSSTSEIGKIEILRKFSFFEIDAQIAPALIKKLGERFFEGQQVYAELSQEKPEYADKVKNKRERPVKSKRKASGAKNRWRNSTQGRRGRTKKR